MPRNLRVIAAYILILILFVGCQEASTEQRDGTAPTVTPPAAALDTQTAARPTASLAGQADARSSTDLIPRAVLFAGAGREQPKVSPDGQWLAFLGPVNGVANFWVAPLNDVDQARPLTNDSRRLGDFDWAYTSQHLLFTRDTNGDENHQLYVVDIATGQERNLTPIVGTQSKIVKLSPTYPDEVLIQINDRDPSQMDLYRVNIRTGTPTLVFKNTRGFQDIRADADFRPRFASFINHRGESSYYVATADAWEVLMKIPIESGRSTGVFGITAVGDKAYLVSSIETDTSALYELDMATGKQTLLVHDPRADLELTEYPLFHPRDGHVQAIKRNYLKREWQIIDPAIAEDFDYLKSLGQGIFDIISRSLDDTVWTVAYDNGGSTRHYLYRRDPTTGTPGTATPLFEDAEASPEYPQPRMHSVVIPARDGLELVSYYVLPPTSDPDGDGRPNAPIALVMQIHGGPAVRDNFGVTAEHQWLTNRGYAVMNVNYRGSLGFGKQFLAAGHRQWGRAMHTDVLDAVDWAIAQGIADPKRVAIIGSSYGGYETLWAMTNSSDVFACGSAHVGPANLVTMMENLPAFWGDAAIELEAQEVGEWRTEEGYQDMLARSPISHVNNIKGGMLIFQGALDPRVPRQESDQMVQAMVKNGVPVTYVLFPNEGHGFGNLANYQAKIAVEEVFLAHCLGGLYEPITDFAGSQITVPVGADIIPGVTEALARE